MASERSTRAPEVGDQDVLGHFALAKALDADLLGQSWRRGVDRLVHLGFVDLDGELDSVVF
jgi:hypothetical protein